MKTTLLLILLAIMGIQANSQTLRETELWIIDKIESNQYHKIVEYEGYTPAFDFSYTYGVSFTGNGELFISENQIHSLDYMPPTYRTYLIPIKYMKKITYAIEDDCVRVWIPTDLQLTRGENVVLINNCDDSWCVMTSQYTSGFQILLSKTFLNDDLPNRFIEAMNHLIELHGGEVVKEVF